MRKWTAIAFFALLVVSALVFVHNFRAAFSSESSAAAAVKSWVGESVPTTELVSVTGDEELAYYALGRPFLLDTRDVYYQNLRDKQKFEKAHAVIDEAKWEKYMRELQEIRLGLQEYFPQKFLRFQKDWHQSR